MIEKLQGQGERGCTGGRRGFWQLAACGSADQVSMAPDQQQRRAFRCYQIVASGQDLGVGGPQSFCSQTR